MKTLRSFTSAGASILGFAVAIGGANIGRSESAVARWATFEAEAGQTYYALSLQADFRKPTAGAKRVVVLVDTSASQAGLFRSDSLAIVKSFAEGLLSDVQVSIVACDVEAVDLTSGLQSPSSSNVTKAMEALDQRLPLGTTDLAAAIRKAQKILGNDPNGSIVYIGDGVVRSHVLNKDEFRNLITELVQSKTSVSSLAIGPFLNVEGLATLANHTGGRVFVRQNVQGSTQQIGQTLANAAMEPVFWVENSQLPKALSSHLPETLPPLRSDRDSILIGLQSDAGATPDLKEQIVLKGSVGGEQRELGWSVASEKSNPDFAFLRTVVDKARTDKGLFLPTAGSDALRDLSMALVDNASDLVESGRFALQSGDTSAAIKIADEALSRDPNSLEAKNLRDAAQQKIDARSLPRKAKFIQTAATQDIFGNPLSPAPAAAVGEITDLAAPAAATPVPAAVESGVVGGNAAPLNQGMLVVPPVSAMPSTGYSTPAIDGLSEIATAGDLLSQEEGLRRLKAERMQAEVDARLRDARNQLGRDPAGVESNLKLLLSEIRRASELEPGPRGQMEAKIRSAIEASSRGAAAYREQSARAEAIATQASATERLLSERERASASVQQLVERFNALMTQQLYSEANNQVAPVINDLLPDTVISRAVEVESGMAANHALVEDVVYLKRRGFIDVMYQNEKTSIPFADEPPIVYPPADVWRALSARRLERYGSIDLAAGTSPGEKRIYDSLKEKVTPEFNGTTLGAVLSGWATQMNIPIVIDNTSLEAAGGATAEEPITLSTPEITLRSALRLILEPRELTYVIQDEVMQITTKDKGSARVLRIYPVGDLVIPVMSGGGGGMGGGMGGMGGGMGGMGGGMGGGGMGGGMGGMGGGGGGGFGGGGAFAVPDEPSKADSPVRTSDAQSENASPLERSEILIEKILATDEEKAREAIEQQLAVLVNEQLIKAKALLAGKNPSQVKAEFQTIIDIVSLALRRGTPQPWMYEALSLSMQVCEYPAADIRRVLLSAVDFSGDVEDAIKIGKYLAKTGMPKEALIVWRDAARSQPLRADIYEMALPVAKKLEDLEGLQWTCTGVLSQAWPKQQAKLVEDAEIAAKAALIRLLSEGRVVESKIFEEQLKNSTKRDVVIRVSWTGKADLDISVEEPSGTICSLSNPRTIGGGILLNDGNANDTPTADGFSESYACPQGYSGEYRILIQRIWGEVAGGKVTVDILTDFGTPDQNYRREQIVLSDKDALVKIAVKNGHRETPLTDVIAAKTEMQKLAAGRAVLAQQLGDAQFNSILNGIASANSSANSGGNNAGGIGNNSFFNPFRGAVGYRPLITLIPQGMQWQPAGPAIISGDKRYVRIGPFFPVFNDIIQVDTFNFIDGTGTTSGGGLGGGGGGGGFGGGGAF